jgi:hypothetical protein
MTGHPSIWVWGIAIAIIIFVGTAVNGQPTPSLIREDIGEPEVLTKVIIVCSICGVLLLTFILWSIFGSYDRNAPKSCRFGHYHRTDGVIGQGRSQRMYCPKCGKDFGEYRLLSTMDRETLEVKNYDKDGNEILE